MKVVVLALALPAGAWAQSSSINAFSPYTCYGLGDMSTPGTAYLRSMGGIGVAFRNQVMINYMNPASYSAVQPKSFLFNFGMEGQNFYLKTGESKNSYNTFNVRDVGIAFPIARRLGFGLSVTPLSNVGYRMEETVTDPDILATVGQVKYKYSGEGGLTQFKAGVGMEIAKGLSVGAEMIYYLGSIDRYIDQYITPITSSGSYSNMNASTKESVCRIFGNCGIQYDVLATEKRMLTLGVTYQLGGELRSDITKYVPSGDMYADTVSLVTSKSDFTLPSNLTVGLFYQTAKIGVGFDYSYQNWAGKNKADEVNGVKFVDTHSIKVGGQYTPDWGDIRHFYRRLTYRAGFRYSTYYMQLKGQNISDKAVTVGVGIPINMKRLSNINVGAEYGVRGNTRRGMIRENYFKFSIGLSLFGEDFWFVKPKYD